MATERRWMADKILVQLLVFSIASKLPAVSTQAKRSAHAKDSVAITAYAASASCSTTSA
jgi:hypothetical protein